MHAHYFHLKTLFWEEIYGLPPDCQRDSEKKWPGTPLKGMVITRLSWISVAFQENSKTFVNFLKRRMTQNMGDEDSSKT